MQQLSIDQALELLDIASTATFSDYNDLHHARMGGIEAYNAGLGIDACPYQPDRSARRRSVWIASWLQQRGYMSGYDRKHEATLTARADA